MSRTALFDAVRPFAPGRKLTPEMVPLIDAVADAFGLASATASNLGRPDPELITALKKDEGLRLKAYPDPLSPRAKTGRGPVLPGLSAMAARVGSSKARRSRRRRLRLG